MAIDVINNTIILNNEDIDINELHQHFIRNDSKLITKSDGQYLIDCNVVLQNNSRLYCSNTNIMSLGALFRITTNSTLQLGDLTDNGCTNGCKLYLPNVRDDFSFGSELKLNGGNLLAYDSHIVANCHWGFRSTNNVVNIIDCIIEGYGTIAGSESIIRNVTYDNLNIKYGILKTIGLVSEYKNIHINNVLPNLVSNTELDDINEAILSVGSDVRKLLIGLGKDIKLQNTVISKNNGIKIRI